MNQPGHLFNIQRASLDDGPGVRTTLFLKGCPLRCPWCHNPESQKMRPELLARADKCLRCGACAAACTNNAIENALADRNRCVACGKCAKVCEYGALKIAGREYTVCEATQEALKDKAFFKATGGGVTLSGGEPLMQPEFSLKVLMALKEHGVHTCIETCGICADGVIESLAPYVGQWLYDIKLMDEQEHHSQLGAPLSDVLKGLTTLKDLNASVTLRCPIIPGVNDNEAHFYAVKKLARDINAPIEILPYHRLGIGKYSQLGRETPIDIPSPSAREVAAWEDAVK